MLEIINLVTTIAKNTHLTISISGKAAAVAMGALGGVAGGCYITHEILEYKKMKNGSSVQEHPAQQHQIPNVAEKTSDTEQCVKRQSIEMPHKITNENAFYSLATREDV